MEKRSQPALFNPGPYPTKTAKYLLPAALMICQVADHSLVMLGYGFYPDEANADAVALAIPIAHLPSHPAPPQSSTAAPSETQIFHLRSDPIAIPLELLSTTAHLVANTREGPLLRSSTPSLSSTTPQPTADPPSHAPPPTPTPPTISPGLQRNRAAVAAQLLLLLRKHAARIRAHDPPPAPRNQRQRDTKRYRDGQLRVLDLYARRLVGYLGALAAEGCLLAFRRVLEESPECVARPFRAAVRAGLGTRRVEKLVRGGMEEAVWTLWVCTVWAVVPMARRGEGSGSASRGSDESRSGESGSVGGTDEERMLRRLGRWKRFLEQAYGAPPGWGPQKDGATIDDQRQEGDVKQAILEMEKTDPQQDGDVPDEVAAESYMNIVKAAAERDPGGIYVDERWTPTFLAWGLKVWCEEAVLVPHDIAEEEEEDDEDELKEICDSADADEEGGELKQDGGRCEHVLFLEDSDNPNGSGVTSEESSVLMMEL